MKDWKIYFNKHKERKPKQQLLDALEFTNHKDIALDLGCGLMIESQEILKAGFKKVVAVDSAEEVPLFYEELNNPNIILQLKEFKDLKIEANSFDLINAEFSLPFYGKEGFELFFNNIKEGLKKDGIFTAQLFGIRDSWNTSHSKMIFHTRDEVMSLLKELELIEFKEEEKDAPSSTEDMKHWHIFRFIVRK